MIADLPRWTRTSLARSGVVFTAPDDARTTVTIQPGRRPLCSLRSIVAARFPDATIGPIRRIVSENGEYAAVTTLPLVDGVWSIGVAIEDDAYTSIECMAPELATSDRVVVELLRSRVFAGAPHRARMVPYRIPDRWFGVRRSLATCWLAPAYPRDRSRIVVCDAISNASAIALTRELLWPCAAPVDAAVEQIERTSLRGTLTSWTGDGAISANVDLTDGAFHYRAQLRDGTAAALTTLRDVIATLEPIERPISAIAIAASELFDWLT